VNVGLWGKNFKHLSSQHLLGNILYGMYGKEMEHTSSCSMKPVCLISYNLKATAVRFFAD
jgi:hypothetical protein